jgi:hypothetical protein
MRKFSNGALPVAGSRATRKFLFGMRFFESVAGEMRRARSLLSRRKKIGNWKAHVRRLPDRLVGSNNWIEYNGISNHKKLLDSNANFEEFEVDNPEKHLHIKAQTLRLYNPDTRQWSIYLLDLDKGVLSIPPVVGEFNGNRGEFYDQEQYKGRSILVRYVWLNISTKSARMEQSFSADGGKTWETNWICELSR